MELLKLLALDEDDLKVMSAHLQDAVMRVGDIAYRPAEKRFAMIANRFDWESADENSGDKKSYQRRRSAMRFERVLGAQVQNINLKAESAVLELLAIQFEEADKPEGYVTLVFAGGGAIRLHVECIEAEMKDMGPVWETTNKPEHKEDGDAAAGA